MNKYDQVTTTQVKDSVSGECVVGHNKNACKKLGKKAPTEPTYLQKQRPDVKPALNRSPATCAEQGAFNELGSKNPNFEAKNVQTSTVRTTTEAGRASVNTIARCGNCKAFGDMMGTVYTDMIPETKIPLSGSWTGGALYYMAALPFFDDGEGSADEA